MIEYECLMKEGISSPYHSEEWKIQLQCWEELKKNHQGLLACMDTLMRVSLTYIDRFDVIGFMYLLDRLSGDSVKFRRYIRQVIQDFIDMIMDYEDDPVDDFRSALYFDIDVKKSFQRL